MKDSEERKKFEEFKMKKRSIQKRLRPTLSSPEGEIGKGDLEPRIKRLKIDYPATNDVIDGRVKLTEALPQVEIRTKKVTVALNPDETFKNKKRKLDISLPQMESPKKIQNIKNYFSSTEQYWVIKQRSTASKHGTGHSHNELVPGGSSSVNWGKQTKGSGGI